jgi:K+-sensing histidine kinase KdpD
MAHPLAALAVAVLVRWLLGPGVGRHRRVYHGVRGDRRCSVWMGGYRPAMVVAVLGYLACHYLFIPPRGSFHLGEARVLVGLLLYLVTASHHHRVR